MSLPIVRNLQRTRPVHTLRLRRFTRSLLHLLLPDRPASIAIHLVTHRTIARLNHRFLQHEGSTDIITFDYTGAPGVDGLAGELFISIDDAVDQARRFRTTWTAELARYVVHGLLHLTGHDDHKPADRRRMKAAEDRLLRQLARTHPFHRLAARSSSPPGSTRRRPNPSSRNRSTAPPTSPPLPGGEGRLPADSSADSSAEASAEAEASAKAEAPAKVGGEGGPFFRRQQRAGSKPRTRQRS